MTAFEHQSVQRFQRIRLSGIHHFALGWKADHQQNEIGLCRFRPKLGYQFLGDSHIGVFILWSVLSCSAFTILSGKESFEVIGLLRLKLRTPETTSVDFLDCALPLIWPVPYLRLPGK